MKAYRLLRANEIECRISSCNQYEVQILLYKDARVDMNLLDEVHGSLGWQNQYELIDGQLFCVVEVWDAEKGMWISKENVGVESYTEKEKGRASDAFKRACFNLGIGRELYTAPDMKVKSKDLKTHSKDENGRWTCRDTFKVESIEYDGDRISYVTIKNLKTQGLLEFGEPVQAKNQREELENMTLGEAKAAVLRSRMRSECIDAEKLLSSYGVTDTSELTEKQFSQIFNHWAEVKQYCGKETEE